MLEGCASLTLLPDGLIDITRKTDEEVINIIHAHNTKSPKY